MRGDAKPMEGDEKLMEGELVENRSGTVCGASCAHGLPTDSTTAKPANEGIRAII